MGLLWYDTDPKRPAAKKIDDEIERYRLKFGATPNTCYVNPAELATHPLLKIVAKPMMHLNHYLVGVEEDAKATSQASLLGAMESRRRRRTGEKAERAGKQKTALKLVEA